MVLHLRMMLTEWGTREMGLSRVLGEPMESEQDERKALLWQHRGAGWLPEAPALSPAQS